MFFYPIVVLLFFLLYNAYSLYSNYKSASKLGLSRIIIPITPDNSLWIAFQTAFKVIVRRFPFGATSFTRHIRLGWEFHDRFRTPLQLGDAFVLITPIRNWVFVANAAAVTDIFSRGKGLCTAYMDAWYFYSVSRVTIYLLESEPLNVFGPNISTVRSFQTVATTKCS